MARCFITRLVVVGKSRFQVRPQSAVVGLRLSESHLSPCHAITSLGRSFRFRSSFPSRFHGFHLAPSPVCQGV